MKYTIEGFNQEEIIKLGNIDVDDLVILRWIVDFEPNMTKKNFDDETYFWINYQSLLSDLPILNIKKLALYRRLNKMCELGILKHKNVKENGNYSYYAFGENYINLVLSSKIEPCIAEDKTLLSSKIKQNNPSIKEINLLNNSIPIIPLTNYEGCKGTTNSKGVCSKRARLKIGNLCLCEQHARMYLTQIGRTDLIAYLEKNTNGTEDLNGSLFDKFWNVYPRKVSKGNAEKWFVKNKPSEELVKTMIKKINLLKNTEQWKKNNGQYIPYPSTWLNAKGWEDEINDNDIAESDEEEIVRLKAEVERRKANGDW